MTKAGMVAGSSEPRRVPSRASSQSYSVEGRGEMQVWPPWLAGKVPSHNLGVMRTVAPAHHVGNEDTGHRHAVTNHSGSI